MKWNPHVVAGCPGDIPKIRGDAKIAVLRRSLTRGATRFLACAAALAASAVLAAAPAAAADAGTCQGGLVRTLGGAHAVTRVPIGDVASLRQRLPDLEASIRAVVGKDPTLGPVVAEALIAAIRDGSGIVERPMLRNEAVHWMAYQASPGQYDAISPACLRLERKYEAYEITVEVPGPEPVAQAPTCVLTATRNCVAGNATFTVDLRGSSPGAQVTLATGGQPAVAIGGPGESWTVPDPGPFELDAVFTVRAQGAPAPARTARIFRFLMPKICGNVAYLGEDPSRTIAPEAAAASCEKSVSVDRCVPVVPPPPPVAPPVALCEPGWIARPFLFAFFPTGDDAERDIVLPTGPARESFTLDRGYGIGGSLERRLGPVLGLEGAAMFGRGDSEFELDNGSATARDSHPTTFYALTFGPNFHLLGCAGADLYLGPFLGYGGFADPNYWAFGHHFAANFDARFLWGAQIGLDVPFRADGPWAFHGGLRYMKLSQDTDAGSMRVDPLLLEVGLAYRF